MNEKELANLIQTWFNQNFNRNTNFWNRNPVGKVLKKNLKTWRHWKNKPKR
jgi:hypothetical protein